MRARSLGARSEGPRQNRSVLQRRNYNLYPKRRGAVTFSVPPPPGWRSRLLLLGDFNLVSGHVRGHYTTTCRVGASPIWFGLTGFSSDRGLIKGRVPSGRGANRRRSCSAQGVGARAASGNNSRRPRHRLLYSQPGSFLFLAPDSSERCRCCIGRGPCSELRHIVPKVCAISSPRVLARCIYSV